MLTPHRDATILSRNTHATLRAGIVGAVGIVRGRVLDADRMKVPFRRNQAAAPETDLPAGGGDADPPATGAPHVASDPLPGDSQQTLVAPTIPTVDAAPLDPPPTPADETQGPTPSGNRAKLRRRMRYLRRAHELALRDLGGLVFDLHRFGKRNDQLVVGKLHALDNVDTELRAIERVLDDHRDITELHEPGVTACARCGALHGTDARFCSSCGTQVNGPVAVAGAPLAPVTVQAQTADPVTTPAQPTPPAPRAIVAPPVPPSGPAPAAPPLWSVPQQAEPQPDEQPERNTATPDQP